MFIASIFVFFMLLGVASAQEDSNVAIDDNVSLNENSQAISFDGVVSTQEKDFWDLKSEVNNLSDGDTLNLTSDYKNDNSSQFREGIIIAQNNVVINGNNHILNANGGEAIFNVQGANITLKNLVFVNVTFTGFGGAINSLGHNLTIINSTFENNTAFYGAAISTSANNLKLINSTFANNKAMGDGGVIYNTGNNLTLINSTFANNKAMDNGGVIYNTGNNLAVINSTFNKNNAGKSGGAIYNSGSRAVLSKSKFSNNTAESPEYGGGAVYNTGDNFDVISSEFTNNGVNFFGGAIYNDGVNFTVSDSNFIKCFAHDGGAICNKAYNFTISNSEFEDNFAGADGGAIFNHGINLKIDESIFNNNTANVEGGVINNYADNFIISNSEFENNSAKNGGVIFNQGVADFCCVINSTFDNNNVSGVGGAIDNNGGENFTVSNSTFDNNVADGADFGYSGGAIYNDGVNFKIVDSKFNKNIGKNSGDYGGGAIYNGKLGDSLTINNSVFTDNVASVVGGAIFNYGKNFTLNNSIFNNNVAANEGGAVYNYGDNSKIADSKFINNTAKDYNGGAVFNQAVNFTISNSVFTNNTAKDNGGAIGNYGSNFTVNNNSIFTNNTANYGGAIFAKWDPNVKIEDSIFTNNSAKYSGGTIYNNVANFSVSNCVFENDTTENKGDIIYNNEDGSLNLTNNTYSGIADGKTVIYNRGLLYSAVITVLENKTIDALYNANVWLFATITSDNASVAGQTLYFIIDNVKYEANSLQNGSYTANYTVKFLSKKTVNASYDGVNTVGATVNTGAIDSRTIPEINVNVTNIVYGENATIIVNVLTDVTGNVSVTIDNKTYNKTFSRGKAIFNVPGLLIGNYNISVNYAGNDAYLPVTKQANITVSGSAILNVDDIVMRYNDGTRFTATLIGSDNKPVANAALSFVVNGVNYTQYTDENGVASIALNLLIGNYTGSVSFNGAELYGNASKNITINVKSSIEGSDLVKIYLNETPFCATFYGEHGELLANTNVTYIINGVSYTRQTNETGVAKLNINLRPGNYTLTAINPFNEEQKEFNVSIKSLIETSDLTKYYINASKFEAKVFNKDGSLAVGKTVKFNINGVFYNRTVEKDGFVRLSINLRPGNYTITSYYEGLEIGNKVEVLPTLVTSDISMKFQDGTKFIAKTLDGQGNSLANQNLTFNIHGVFYNATTGSDGIAELNINLMKGKYIITSYWKDYEIGNNIVIS